jgi:cell division protein ZapA
LSTAKCAIRDAGKVKGTDRIAVMAALSMAGEFRRKRRRDRCPTCRCWKCTKMAAMHKVLDAALTPQEALF